MNPSGILILHKPRGMTSHDCVMKVRRLFQTKKVGHTGTLDPDVNGVLPICIGKATKVVEYMSDYSKEYEGEVTMGYSTTTEDKSGDRVHSKPVTKQWNEKEIEETLEQFRGDIIQVPPMYSAVKVKGKKLYEYARAGQEVERPQRRITIHSLERLSEIIYKEETASFRFRVHCSKGTYVRTLAVDIGQMLGYPAHMSDLVRTSSGPYKLEDSKTFEQLEKEKENGTLFSHLIPFDTAVDYLPSCVVDQETEQLIKNGSVLPVNKGLEEMRFTVYNEKGDCLAVYKQHPTKDGLIKPEKMFWTGESV
ncbi:tRNA pseudouridine(55) synthase TruB [Alkalihalobacillus sp. MEB130]|uniref:tRNA pseudouridine(55) synthase TruB n=1 Tax=Alkalihalobacillus sp. MEB130 TaxID=2976704 RepID=UPI0028DEFB91|nr:tRNA pseudouridine(55) synthase TruB [Alkalihalobacillus sp. MEB130]MDT8858982.1 tRNA pseudouridine(55) synthase TruB [Alkalihalobacillus sp. MEB130]